VVRGVPLCMAQFQHIFGSARMPVLNAPDVVESYDKSAHVAVMCRGRFYYFSALHSDHSVAVDVEDLALILEAIMADAAAVQADPSKAAAAALGLMTTQQRNTWALARANLTRDSPNNAKTLGIVDSALFVLVLDEFTPGSIHEAAANCLHGTYDLREGDGKGQGYQAGTCLNRW
jgi:carnitine O-acetyltransferase